MNTAFDVPAVTDDDNLLAWQEQALCAQTDPEAFFPDKGGSTREAKRICVGCEVKQECLEYALANDERFGIFGGLSERERRRLKSPKVSTKPAAGVSEPKPIRAPKISMKVRQRDILNFLVGSGGSFVGTACDIGRELPRLTQPSSAGTMMHVMVARGLIAWEPRGRFPVNITVLPAGHDFLEAAQVAA